MGKYNWVDISRDDVIRAMEKFKKYNPEYPEPKSTFLIYEGEKLPAKHIRGMAYEFDRGDKTKDLSKNALLGKPMMSNLSFSPTCIGAYFSFREMRNTPFSSS